MNGTTTPSFGVEGITHSLGKPFSDDYCAQYLAAMTALFSLLPPPPASIVEFGCGTGWLSLYLARRGYEVLGVDISEDAVASARRAAETQNLGGIKFVASDYEEFSPAGSSTMPFFMMHSTMPNQSSPPCAVRTPPWLREVASSRLNPARNTPPQPLRWRR